MDPKSAPRDFTDLTPGTVFEFDQPGFGPAAFIWNGRVGIEITDDQARKLATLSAAEALRTTFGHRSQMIRLFGPPASEEVNKDFSRVTILSTTI